MFIGVFYRQFDVVIESVVFFLFFCYFFKHERAVQVSKWQRLGFFGTTTIQLHNLLKISSRQLMKRLAYCGSDGPGLYNSLEKLTVAENCCGTELNKRDKQYL